MSFEVLRDGEVLFSSEGVDHEWRRFYEPYGRDHYFVGPEFETNAEAGTYTVRVHNAANSGLRTPGRTGEFRLPRVAKHCYT